MRMGYIVTNEEMQTKVPGIFAAGDVREKSFTANRDSDR